MIITNVEVKKMLNLDYDFDDEIINIYIESAASFIQVKTGYDFNDEPKPHPLARQCAILYIKQLHYNSDGFNKEYDLSLGIQSLICDLQGIAYAKQKS